MSQEKNPRALKDNEAKAVCRMIRVSPQKLNLVAALIRGRRAEEVASLLSFYEATAGPDPCDSVRRALQGALDAAQPLPLQRDGGGGQWCRGKTFDTFAPLGPVLVTRDDIPNPNALTIRTIGIKRAAAKITLANLAYNMHRLIFHERRAAMG